MKDVSMRNYFIQIKIVERQIVVKSQIFMENIYITRLIVNPCLRLL